VLFDCLERLLASHPQFQLRTEIQAGEELLGSGEKVVSTTSGWLDPNTSVAGEVRTRHTVLIDLDHWDTILDYARKDAYELVRFYYRPRIDALVSHLTRKMAGQDEERPLREAYREIVFDFVKDGYDLDESVLLKESPVTAARRVADVLRQHDLL